MNLRPGSTTWMSTASTRSCCTRVSRCSSDRVTRSPRCTIPRSSPTACARTTTGSPSSAPTRPIGCSAWPARRSKMSRVRAPKSSARSGTGCAAVFVRPSAYVDELPLNHHVYDDFWSTCQELGVPVAFHPGVHVDTPGACRKFGLVAISENATVTNMAMDEIHGGSALGQAVGNPVDMIITMGRVLMGGVCERFPRLKLVFLESSGGWMPSMLERMDEQVQAFPLERRWLSLLPSEYFARQCYVSFEPEEWNLAAAAEQLGTDRILWASDYPHPEYHPGVLDELRERIAPLADVRPSAHPRRERDRVLRAATGPLPHVTAPTPGSGEWRALVDEPVIDPEQRIVDPHHHLWPRGPLPYDLADLLADVGSGHRVERTVFMECHAAYRADGPAEFAPVGETEWVAARGASAAAG